MDDIVIIGAGGHGRVVLDILRNNHQYNVIGFLDAEATLHGLYVDGIPVLGDIDIIPTGRAIVAIGDNRIRLDYAETLRKRGVNLVNAIHPSANIAGNAVIGDNVVIAAGSNICTHADIRDSVIINTGAIVEHECTIGPGAHIGPGAKLAGHVVIGNGAFVGIGAAIIQGITIGKHAIAGAGAVVLHDVGPYSAVVGVPAKQINLHKEHS